MVINFFKGCYPHSSNNFLNFRDLPLLADCSRDSAITFMATSRPGGCRGPRSPVVHMGRKITGGVQRSPRTYPTPLWTALRIGRCYSSACAVGSDARVFHLAGLGARSVVHENCVCCCYYGPGVADAARN